MTIRNAARNSDGRLSKLANLLERGHRDLQNRHLVRRPACPANLSLKSSMSLQALTEPTLVLNKSWTPIHVCSAKRAFVLVFKGLARAMGGNFVLHDFSTWMEEDCPEGMLSVQAVSRRIRVPEVIVLTHCDRYLKPRVAFTRRNVFRRDAYTCQYCSKKCSGDDLSIDHVVPRSRGGQGSWTNCVVACRRCNERKANRLLSQVGMQLLRPPKEPPAHMAFTMFVGRRKPSWEQFVASTGAARTNGDRR